jgi:hypothetical protein
VKEPRRRLEVNLEELDRVLDGARQAPLSDQDHHKLREALHAMAAMLVRPRNTEKTSSVVGKPEDASGDSGKQPAPDAPPPAGHGRNGAEAFSGAHRVEIKHQTLAHGDRCPECRQGNVYAQQEPKVLVRVTGQAPLAATIYSLERLRCRDRDPPGQLSRPWKTAVCRRGGELPSGMSLCVGDARPSVRP